MLYYFHEGIIKRVAHGSCWHTPIEVVWYMINVLYSFERGSELQYNMFILTNNNFARESRYFVHFFVIVVT